MQVIFDPAIKLKISQTIVCLSGFKSNNSLVH